MMKTLAIIVVVLFGLSSTTLTAAAPRDVKSAIERIFKSRLDDLNNNALCKSICHCEVKLLSASAKNTNQTRFPFEAIIEAKAESINLHIAVRAEFDKACNIRILNGTEVIDNSNYGLHVCSGLLAASHSIAKLKADFTAGREHKVEEADCNAANAEFSN